MPQSDFYKDHGISVRGVADAMRQNGQLPDLSQRKRVNKQDKSIPVEKPSLIQKRIDSYNEKFSGRELDIQYKDGDKPKDFILIWDKLSQSKNPQTSYLFFIKASSQDINEPVFVIIDTRVKNKWSIRSGSINGADITPSENIRSELLYSLTNNLASLRAQKFESKGMETKRYKITENKTGKKFAVSALNEEEAKEKVKKFLNEGSNTSEYDYWIQNRLQVQKNRIGQILNYIDKIENEREMYTWPDILRMINGCRELIQKTDETFQNLVQEIVNLD